MNKTTKKQTTVKKASKKPADPVAGPGEIVIRNGNGPAVVKAETLHEFFAMHKPVTANGTIKAGHTLTHIPSGYSIGTYRTRLLAMWVAQQLRAFGGADLWQFTDPNTIAKHADKMLLVRLRRLADPTTAEQDMKDGALTPAAAPKKARATQRHPVTYPSAAEYNAAYSAPAATAKPKYSAPWRSGVDWVAAGKKAYETRLRNLAAKQAPPAPPAPAPKAPKAPALRPSQAPKASAPKAPRPPALRPSQAPPAPGPKAPKAPAPAARPRRAPVTAGARS